MLPLSLRLLIERHGDMTFENLLRSLRCKRCRAVKPAPVYLIAGHHGAAGLTRIGRSSWCRLRRFELEAAPKS